MSESQRPDAMTPEFEMPEGGKEALKRLYRESLTEALVLASSETFADLTPLQARSLCAGALVHAAADLAAEGARFEGRRPRITRFLGMCRHYFEAARDGPWETWKPTLRWILTYHRPHAHVESEGKES